MARETGKLTDRRMAEAAARGDAACLELEDAAVDYGIEFDLPCER